MRSWKPRRMRCRQQTRRTDRCGLARAMEVACLVLPYFELRARCFFPGDLGGSERTKHQPRFEGVAFVSDSPGNRKVVKESLDEMGDEPVDGLTPRAMFYTWPGPGRRPALGLDEQP